MVSFEGAVNVYGAQGAKGVSPVDSLSLRLQVGRGRKELFVPTVLNLDLHDYYIHKYVSKINLLKNFTFCYDTYLNKYI